MVKLFCIPHSGASAMVYSNWKKKIGGEIEIMAVEVAGHGTRMREKCFINVHDSAKDLARNIAPQIDDDDYAIFGHSLGALLAYETYFELIKLGVKKPIHMFFSGRKAPNDIDEETNFYLLPDEEFIQVVEAYGNTTKEVFANETLRELFMPIMRADFQMGETYRYQEKKEKIECNITVINGDHDMSVARSNMNLWSMCGTKNCTVVYYPGGHFYLFEQVDKLLKMISDSLTKRI